MRLNSPLPYSATRPAIPTAPVIMTADKIAILPRRSVEKRPNMNVTLQSMRCEYVPSNVNLQFNDAVKIIVDFVVSDPTRGSSCADVDCADAEIAKSRASGFGAAVRLARTAKRRLTAASAESHFTVHCQQNRAAREDEYLFTIVL